MIRTETNEVFAPPPKPSFLETLHQRLFKNWFDSLNTVVALVFLIWVISTFLQWAVFGAVWREANVEACQAASGACWSVIEARGRLVLFGLYPFEQHWRSALACMFIILTIIASCIPYFWSARKIASLWLVGFGLFILFMRGGLFGLSTITTEQWGGLSLTIFIFASVALIGMPLSVLLALARNSNLPVIRNLAIGIIDVTRSLPLLTILFTAAVVMPFVLPNWAQGDKLFRVIAAFGLFFAAYQAEIIRGGMQVIPFGQNEAAKALGLSYWHTIGTIILPQAFRNALPATINQFVITFKETSLVVIIGFFEIMASGSAAFGTGVWTHYYVEVYFFVALIYFVFVFGLSRYGAFLENRMRVGHD